MSHDFVQRFSPELLPHSLPDFPTDSSNGLSRRQAILVPSLMGLGLMGGLHGLPALAQTDPLRGSGTPLRGGVLSRRLPGDPPNFDTLANTTGWVVFVAAPCYNALVRFDEFDPDKVIPDLAESIELSADGKAYTFRLRKGVKFHDGAPCTADDVKYTFDVIREPPKGVVSVRANLLDAVESIVTVDSHTVRFNLKRKSPSLLVNLACAWMVVLPKHILEKGPMKDVMVGTGPFKFKEYKRGVSLELVRNPDYHLPSRPYLDGIKYFMIPDESTAHAYFRTGQLDEYVPGPGVALARQRDVAQRAYMQKIFSTGALSVYFNLQEKPYDDIRVRQAIALAIDRQAALNTVYSGLGATAGFSMPGKWALPPAELKAIPGYGDYKDSNIVQAKALLAAAGYPNGFKDTMLARRLAAHEAHAIFIKDQLTKIGIEITLDLQETAAYYQKESKRQWKMIAGALDYLSNDPDAMYADTVTCDGNFNRAKLCDAKIDDLVTRQSQELDEKKRIALVNELEKRVLSQYAVFMVYFKDRFRLYQNNVHGWGLHPNEDNAMRLADCWKSRA
jgi:peptide/nickel transport system substrate-binding protein